jgi:predicted small secreted protein
MKKLLIAVLIVSVVSTVLVSCAGSRGGAGKGCPTTNPRYFRG